MQVNHGKIRAKHPKVIFQKVNKSGITSKQHGKRTDTAVVGDTLAMLNCMKQNSSAYQFKDKCLQFTSDQPKKRDLKRQFK